MKYFLDSAKLDEIELAYRDYGIDGVTTNPKHIKNSGESFETVVQQLAEFAADKPDFPISTPELFARIDGCKVRRRPDTDGVLAALEAGDLAGVARRMYNVFEDVLPERQRARVADIKNTLIQQGALGANMSGTGPTAFGLFEREEAAKAAFELLSQHYKETFLAQTV